MQSVKYIILICIGAVFSPSFNAYACSETALGFALSIPSDIKVCESYISGNDDALQSRMNTLTENDWFGSPKERFYIAKKYAYFNRYENILFRKRSHCTHETHSLIGISNQKGLRTCHIAFEENVVMPLLGKRNNRLSIVDQNYHLTSEEKEFVESDFGKTSIVVSSYCRNSQERRKFITIAVEEPSKPYFEGDKFEIYQSQVKRPLQHLYFTNESCDIPTE